VRFLIDASLSFRVAEALQKAGHDAVHVRDVLTVDAADSTIFDHAARNGRVIVSADTDFGELLARRGTAQPSLVLLRRRTRRRPSEQSTLLLTQLPEVASDLHAGAIVVIEEARVRIRSLPVHDR
jgi:predicted nuclease of predicted toxin-antitoxin system